ncbi:unnamed protein product [Eruca vesicaria subsp. sativa]|uniref:Uncharacterized protein n=1 Tax=Eruca vesicaria subsp. sativa TaxID=29727 RepID=A0ABC8KEU8_ERUVS|nr:unnamed protein product [Eruca vesicaria subsp. sativa]
MFLPLSPSTRWFAFQASLSTILSSCSSSSPPTPQPLPSSPLIPPSLHSLSATPYPPYFQHAQKKDLLTPSKGIDREISYINIHHEHIKPTELTTTLDIPRLSDTELPNLDGGVALAGLQI